MGGDGGLAGTTGGGNDGGREWRGAGMADWRERRKVGMTGGGNGPALPAHGYRMWASPSVFVANQFVIPVKTGIQRPLRQEGWHWTDSPGFPLPDGGRGRASGERCKAQWMPAFAGMTGGRERRKAGMTGGREWRTGGHDGWAGMVGGWERRGLFVPRISVRFTSGATAWRHLRSIEYPSRSCLMSQAVMYRSLYGNGLEPFCHLDVGTSGLNLGVAGKD